MNHCRICVLALILPLAVAAAASAVIIEPGDGTGNVTAPVPDPGWDNVGTVNGLSAVYLGDGWVLTANHVGTGNPVFGGTPYPWVPGVSVRLENPDTSPADLVLFKIAQPFPALPALSIRATSPPVNTSLVMIGNGLNRGAATTWGGHDGWLWGTGVAKRWGTNKVQDASDFSAPFATHVFGTTFDQVGAGHTANEAHAAPGDSGGAASAWNGSSYELVGILIGILEYAGQPDAALYGNQTVAADLSVYRDQIVDWMPEPTGGLWCGAALVAALARRRINAPSSPGSRRTSDRAR